MEFLRIRDEEMDEARRKEFIKSLYNPKKEEEPRNIREYIFSLDVTGTVYSHPFAFQLALQP